MTVTITLNGEAREVPGPLTVAGLLRQFGIKPDFVAVEVNRDLVTRARHDETPLSDGDVVEVVTLVGGGGGSPEPIEPEPLTIEKAQLKAERARATRAARHTVGPRVRKSIKGTVPGSPSSGAAGPESSQ